MEKVRPLMKQKAVFEMAPHTGMHLLLSETITEAGQSVNFCFKTVKNCYCDIIPPSEMKVIAYFTFFVIILVREFTRL